jgi:hypothetical protein
MLLFQSEYARELRMQVVVIVVVLVVGCTTTVPDTTRIQDADLPNYTVGSHRVEEPFDLYIEPRIQKLQINVTPRSDKKSFTAIPIVVGPALEKALLSMTQKHFSKVTTVPQPEGRPTLSYRLLAYTPVISVLPGFLSTRLNVSARLALQVSVHSANGEQFFSTTAIGTSHVSDTTLSTGGGLKDGPRLLEVATRDAIIDAMYDISSIFGNNSEMIRTGVRASEIDPDLEIEKIDDVVLQLRTRRIENINDK